MCAKLLLITGSVYCVNQVLVTSRDLGCRRQAASVLALVTRTFPLAKFLDGIVSHLMPLLDETLKTARLTQSSAGLLSIQNNIDSYCYENSAVGDATYIPEIISSCAKTVQNVCVLPCVASVTSPSAQVVDQRWQARSEYYNRLLSKLVPRLSRLQKCCTSASTALPAKLEAVPSGLNVNSKGDKQISNGTLDSGHNTECVAISVNNNDNNNGTSREPGQDANSSQTRNELTLSSAWAMQQRSQADCNDASADNHEVEISLLKFIVASALLEEIHHEAGQARARALQAPSWGVLIDNAALLVVECQYPVRVGQLVLRFFKNCVLTMPLQRIEAPLARLIDAAIASPVIASDNCVDSQLELYFEAHFDLLKTILMSPLKGSTFLNRALDLALRIWPRVTSDHKSNLRPVIVELFHVIISLHWHYFFPANVTSFLSSTEGSISDAEVEHQAQFISIMMAYGWCLCQRDLDTYSIVLRSLNELERNRSLFRRPAFCSRDDPGGTGYGLLGQFIGVLLQSLLERSHDLLRDEILETIYGMACSMKLTVFQASYLPYFLNQLRTLDNLQREQLLSGLKLQSDLPSFMDSLCGFLTDVRCYLSTNQALPASSAFV